MKKITMIGLQVLLQVLRPHMSVGLKCDHGSLVVLELLERFLCHQGSHEVLGKFDMRSVGHIDNIMGERDEPNR